MPTTTADVTVPALDALRRPIHDYAPENPAGRAFRGGMLDLANLLEELCEDDDDTLALEGEVVWTALHAFPGLIAPGPSPTELLDLVMAGVRREERPGTSPSTARSSTRSTRSARSAASWSSLSLPASPPLCGAPCCSPSIG